MNSVLNFHLPTPEEETRAMRSMQSRIVWTIVRQTLATARLRMALVVALTVLLWGGLYYAVREGFVLLDTIPPPLHEQVVRAIFGTFFFTLMVMLIFSSSVIMYGALFRSQETTYLLTLPVRAERVFLHKFQQAVLLSSWGFILLGSPMLVAYGRSQAAPWYYFAMVLPLMISFVFIPVSLGGMLSLEVMLRLPRRRLQVLVLAIVVAIVALIAFSWSLFVRPASDLLTPRWFQDMLGRLQLTEQRLLPSWWLCSGLLEACERSWSESVMFLSLMISNALFCREVASWLAARVYRRAYNVAMGTGPAKKQIRVSWIDRAAQRLLRRFPVAVRLMFIKDLRLFRRDPIQWSQFVILFGLLFLYFANVHPFSYTIHYAGWVSMVSFMNLSVVGLLMSTFTTRFIFPMISLEGRRFWLLGLLPLQRSTILWSKFLFAIACLLVPCLILVLLSDCMLRVPAVMLVNHLITCLLLCVGLSGIAVGLGARLPDIRQQSPSRIAAGFGGTLNLVISTLYILAEMLLLTLPCHLALATLSLSTPLPWGDAARWETVLRYWTLGGELACLPLALIATVAPMAIGMRAFRRMEL